MAKKRRKTPGHSASHLLAPQARYDAAGSGPRLRSWIAPPTGPNRSVAGAATVRHRARDAVRNEWTAVSAVRSLVSNLVGAGIVARPKTQDAGLKQRLNELWDDWCANADADGRLDFYGLQTLAVRAWLLSGEVFVRLRPRRLEDPLPVPLQAQVVEADLVPMFDADQWSGLQPGNVIRQGIELTPLGDRAAYWMLRAHPGDNPPAAVQPGTLVRVPAQYVLHVYEPQRPGQLRGVSELAAVLARLRSVMNFDDAVLHRQEIANLFAMIVTRPPSVSQVRGDVSDAESLPGILPGATIELEPGQDARFATPPGAGTEYAAFMRWQHLGLAAGAGVPYELLTGDLSNISDRTLRVVINEYRRHCEQRQWQIIIPMFCRPLRAAFADAALLAGRLTPAEAIEARRVTWAPPRWQYIHPVQDVQAAQTEVEAGFRSRGSVIAERGEDPDEVDRERAADAARVAAAGLSAAPLATPPDPDATARTALLEAQARLEAQRAAHEQAQTALAEAQVRLASAEIEAVQARLDGAADERARMAAETAAALQAQSREADARIERIAAEAEAARQESHARMEIMNAAEAHAAELRAMARAIEAERLATARLEVEAARLGLAELAQS